LEISLENNLLRITVVDDLKKYQISQLEYYGFFKANNELAKRSTDLQADLQKVIGFFKDEEISFTIDTVVGAFLAEVSKKQSQLSATFDIAKNIKDGQLDYATFNDFTSFLEGLPRKLKQHQLKAAYHFYTLKNGANFSVPGSGKTTVVLSVYEKLKQEGKCNLLFIVGPPSCFQPWKNEFAETLGRTPDTIILSGGNKKERKREYLRSHYDAHELYLSTFHTIRNDVSEIKKFLAQRGINALLVVDEAHYIKQIGGSWATSLLEIGKFSSYKCILTGTPIPKSYKDIFNLFDFLWLNDSPINETEKIEINLLEKKNNTDEVKEILNEKIGPLFYRVRKKDLGLIPAVFHPPIEVEMNTTEKMIYDYVFAKIFSLNQTDYLRNQELLEKLWRGRMIRLRQAVSYPKLLTTTIDQYMEKFLEDSTLLNSIKHYDQLEIPGKLVRLTELVKTLRKNDQKILIWSNFVGTLHMIKSHLTAMGEKCELIYGKTPVRKDDSDELQAEKTREDIRDEFVDASSGLNILIANPAACAESISLHKTCFHAIYYDLSYNCAQYIQSLDRINRVGGSETKEANYYFLQYRSSIDQDIKRNLELKADKMYNIIDQDYNIYDLDIYEETLDDDVGAYKRLFINGGGI